MGSEILFLTLFGGGVLFFAGRKFRENGMSRTRFAQLASLLFLSAFAFRLLLGFYSEGFSTDINTFKSWAMLTNDVGFSRIYQEDVFLDYPPGYLYVLVFLEKLRVVFGIPSMSDTFSLMIKLPSILADLACAGVLLVLAKRKMGEKNALFLSGAYLFCPVVFINSAQWGQADSFCTAILICSVLLLYREHYIPSAVIYGISIAFKPQMLIFAPLYLFFAIKQKQWLGLGLGIVSGVAALLLVAAPFTQGFDFLWLFQKYKSTLDYYHYYSVNAYNIWALIGWNWKTLPEGALGTALNLIGPVLATGACGALMFLSKRKDAVFACPFILMSVMYLFSIKMHERYWFPAFFFLLLAFLFVRDKRLLRAFALTAAANYLNVAFVLYQFREYYGSYNPNTWLTRSFSAVQLLAFGYLMVVTYSVYVRGTVKEAEHRQWSLPAQPRIPALKSQPGGKMLRMDWVAMALVTLIYASLAFWNLGSHTTAVTAWTPAEGESVVLSAGASFETLYYLPGIAADDSHYTSRVGVNLRVETSTDGETWTDCGTLTEGSVFAWKQYPLTASGTLLRLTALDGSVTLNEIGLKTAGMSMFSHLTAGKGGEALVDEPNTVPLYTTYENSTYFDEIYHPRTAYENILGLEPYENTHPPLGKLIISLGIRAFGMNPFGWRFMGALFGVLMLPVLYHLLKQLFGKTMLCTAGTVLFAFDFMHFTQTRIATIDTYAVFFLLLMYDAMVIFLKQDLKRDGWKRLLPPLLACGIFTGLGIASKWTAAYGALGLAVLFFGKLAVSLLREKREGGEFPLLRRRCLILCLWCCLFFLVIPLVIYFAAFLPMLSLAHNAGEPLQKFWSYQTTMFNYHSQLKAEHYFASPWYEWPFDIRPIWYFSGDPANAQGQYSTISAMGNPLLWWSGIPALGAAVFLWVREKKFSAGLVLVGFLSVYLPWVLIPRLTFIYHYFTAVPFLIIALIGVFERISQTGIFTRRLRLIQGVECSASSLFLYLFVGANLVLFAVFFPVVSGTPTSQAYAQALRLFPTWYF